MPKEIASNRTASKNFRSNSKYFKELAAKVDNIYKDGGPTKSDCELIVCICGDDVKKSLLDSSEIHRRLANYFAKKAREEGD